MILAFAGLKGGQGKSTIVARLGALLAAAGHRVVVVDLAVTGTSSLLLGSPGGAEAGSGTLLTGPPRTGDLVRPTPVHPRLFLVPCDPALASIERLPARDPAKTGLPKLATSFDFVLLDAPPGGGTAALAAVRAAAWTLVPCVADEPGVAGLGATLSWLEAAPGAQVLGIVVNQAEPRAKLLASAEATLRADHGRAMFRAAIRRDPAWRRAATVTRAARAKDFKGADEDLHQVKREMLKRLVRVG